MEPPDQVVAHALLVALVQQLLYRRFVSLGGESFQLLAGGAETGPPHQVSD